ncbi:MAG: PH domain-containing protein [Clostridiales bacterium]|nr:PH domain-containing protein [Clostridiales bacterium]
MDIKVNEEGIEIRKLFGTKRIAFADIRSIEADGKRFTVTSKDDKKIVFDDMLFIGKDQIIRNAVKNNIAYKEILEPEEEGPLYTIEQVREITGKAEEFITRSGNKILSEQLGPEYEICVHSVDIKDCIIMYWSLKKSGRIVDIPEASRADDEYGEDPYAFEDMLIAFLVNWDPMTMSGTYVGDITPDDEKDLADYVKAVMDDFIPEYKAGLSNGREEG